jgi:hypothetical protein
MANIGNFNRVQDYLPLFTAVLITDIVVMLLLNAGAIPSKVLRQWYSKYTLSAVMADVLIIFLVLILTRAVYGYLFDTFSLALFILLAVAIQILHDVSFYVLFTNIPRGANQMMDTFKDYAREASYKAIVADSGMMILSCLIASYLVNQSLNTNIIVLACFLYVLPYVLYN